MNNEQLTEPGLIYSDPTKDIKLQQANPIMINMNAIDKVKNCPLTKFLKDLESSNKE